MKSTSSLPGHEAAQHQLRQDEATDPAAADFRAAALCVAATAALGLVDVLLPRGENVSGAFALVPFLAAALLGPAGTAACGALAAAVSVGLIGADHVDEETAAVRLLVVFAAWGAATWIAAVRVRREQQLARMTRVAEVAQQAILAPVPTITEPYAFASAYRSASSDADVGGDLLDVIDTGRGVGVIVGDVRGKGLDAVRLAAATLRAYREAALTTSDLAATVAATERRIVPQLGEEDFVTAVLAELHPDGTVLLANCAHPPPLTATPSGQRLLETNAPTTPFGLDPQPDIIRHHLAPGERLLLYTDGLIEARAADGNFVPLEHTTGRLGTDPFDQALDTLLDRLRTAVRGQFADDLALLLIEHRLDHQLASNAEPTGSRQTLNALQA